MKWLHKLGSGCTRSNLNFSGNKIVCRDDYVETDCSKDLQPPKHWSILLGQKIESQYCAFSVCPSKAATESVMLKCDLIKRSC